MPPETAVHLAWPGIHSTFSIVAVVVALVVFVLGMFSGAKANKVRIIFAICLATLIGWFIVPVVVKVVSALRLEDTKAGVVIVLTAMMFLVAALATSIYEIITVTLPDIGMVPRK